MLRVPGSSQDLFRIKSEGGDVRVVYSPLDALNLARENPDRQVVFFGIGFETTAPANAMTVYQAKRLGVDELLAAGVARAGAAGHRRDHGVADLPGAGVPRRRSRVQRDGHLGVPAARGEVRRTHRGHRVRAAGHPRGHPQDGAAARVRPARAGERLPAGGAGRRQPDRARRCCRTSSRSPTGPGAASARSRAAAGGSPTPTGTSTPRRASTSAASTPTSRRSAGRARCCRGSSSRTSARPSARSARRATRSGATMVSSEGACAAYYLYRRLETPAAAGAPAAPAGAHV